MKQKYRKMEDHKSGPRLANNLNFAIENGLEPNVKKFSEIVQVGRRGEPNVSRLGSGGRPLGQFFF